MSLIRKISTIIYVLICTYQLYAQDIHDVSAEQVGNNIEISYWLNERADISIFYSTEGNQSFLTMNSISGDVGQNITPGRKKIIWNVLNDLEELITDNLIFKLEIGTDPVLCTIAKQKINLSEFLHIYKKYKEDSSNPIDRTPEEYLDLFINFKLKVKEAEAQGMDQSPEFKKELGGYVNTITEKYMQDNVALDSILKLTYQRLKRIRSASHIAIECPPNSSAEITQEKMSLIEQIRQRVTTGGESFYQVARETSTDPSVLHNNGKLGYIIPLRYVYSFEEAVYNTPIGQVSPIFRSRYGFHIALVEEERENIEVHVAHIMKTHSDKYSAKDSILLIYNKLKNGGDFELLAKSCSDDKGSANRGGDLGWFGRSTMIKEFEDMSFDMYREGAYSEPFESKFGWHIIKYIGMRNYLPMDSVRERLSSQIRKDERYKEVEKSYLRKARAQYDIDTSMNDEQALQYIKEHLVDFNSDYRNEYQQYHDGILLFDISNKEIWEKAVKDEEGLKTYFKTHRKDFTWQRPHFKGYVIYAVNKTTAEAARNIIKNAHPDSIQSYLSQRINLNGKEFARIEYGIWEHGQNKVVDKYGFKDKNISITIPLGFSIVETIGYVIGQPEDFADVKSLVITSYQDYLEQELIKRLRKKYPITINYNVLESITKQNRL